MSETFVRLSKDQIEALKADFQEEDVTVYKRMKNRDTGETKVLHTIRAYSITKRLNDVLGMFGESWGCDVVNVVPIIHETSSGVLLSVKLWHLNRDNSVTIETGCGFSKDARGNFRDVADAVKSAVTEAISKWASYIGVGDTIFSGNYDAPPEENGTDDSFLPPSQGAEGTPNCPKCGNPLVVKTSKKGNKFWGCKKFPQCDGVQWMDQGV